MYYSKQVEKGNIKDGFDWRREIEKAKRLVEDAHQEAAKYWG